MASFIAVHEKKGIYLGAVAGYALFSNVGGVVFSSKAIRFNSADEVMKFFETSLPGLREGVSAVEIQTKETGNYVDVVDILKSGYYNHTDTMVEALPPYSETIH